MLRVSHRKQREHHQERNRDDNPQPEWSRFHAPILSGVERRREGECSWWLPFHSNSRLPPGYHRGMEIVLPGLCLLMFLLIVARKPLTAAFQQLMDGKSADADEQLQEIIARERQRMKDEAASADQKDPPPDAP